MVGHLYADTDAATMVLFDPEAAATALRESTVVGQEEVETAAAAGDMVHWYTTADGAFRLQVFVDEAVPDVYVSRGSNRVEGRLLHVPSGRLVFSGAEMLLDRPEEWDVRSATMTLPPGDYALEAFEVDWSSRDDAEFERRWRAEAGAIGATAVRVLGLFTGLLVLVSLGLFIPTVVLLTKPAKLWEGIVRVGPWIGGAWVFVLVAWRLPPVRRINAVRERLEREQPDAVVSLRRLSPGEARPERGASFGEGIS